MIFPYFQSLRYGLRRAQAALSMMLMIGGIIIAVGVTLVILYISFVNSTYAYQLAQRTGSTAIAGAEDTLMQLARGKTVASLGTYVVSIDGNAATVTVTQQANGQISISSRCTIFGFSRTLQVIASANLKTNQISVISWKFI